VCVVAVPKRFAKQKISAKAARQDAEMTEA
jgi:hypothetical protein